MSSNVLPAVVLSLVVMVAYTIVHKIDEKPKAKTPPVQLICEGQVAVAKKSGAMWLDEKTYALKFVFVEPVEVGNCKIVFTGE